MEARLSDAMDGGLMTERNNCQVGQLSLSSESAGSRAASGPALGPLPTEPLASGGATTGSTKGADMQFVTNFTQIKFQNNFLPKKRVN